jgi:hypothetical protein
VSALQPLWNNPDTQNSTNDSLGQSLTLQTVNMGNLTPGNLSPKGILKLSLKRPIWGIEGELDEQESPRKKVRFRHRIVCMFKSERGSEEFEKMIRKWGM